MRCLRREINEIGWSCDESNEKLAVCGTGGLLLFAVTNGGELAATRVAGITEDSSTSPTGSSRIRSVCWHPVCALQT